MFKFLSLFILLSSVWSCTPTQVGMDIPEQFGGSGWLGQGGGNGSQGSEAEVGDLIEVARGSGIFGGSFSEDGIDVLYGIRPTGELNSFLYLKSSSFTPVMISTRSDGSSLSDYSNPGWDSGAWGSGDHGNLASLSSDGRYAFFQANADNTDGFNTTTDHSGTHRRIVFRKDIVTGDLEPIVTLSQVHSTFQQATAGSVSRDGRFIVFANSGNELNFGIPLGSGVSSGSGFSLVLRDLSNISGSPEVITYRDEFNQNTLFKDLRSPSLSNNGRFVVFESSDDRFGTTFASGFFGSQARSAIVLMDTNTRQSTVINTDSSLASVPQSWSTGIGYLRISGNASKVVFSDQYWDFSWINNTRMFVYDRTTGVLSNPVSGPGYEEYQYHPCDLSDDGRYLAFISNNLSLVGKPGFSRRHLFVTDLQENEVILISKNADDTPMTFPSGQHVTECKFNASASEVSFVVGGRRTDQVGVLYKRSFSF